jgi:uncharacterized protein YjiS (DUF1127 family)
MEQVLRYESACDATGQRMAPAPKMSAAVMTGLQWIVGNVQVWNQRIRQRQALAELDDHLLKDIGVSPTAARIEASQAFWR